MQKSILPVYKFLTILRWQKEPSRKYLNSLKQVRKLKETCLAWQIKQITLLLLDREKEVLFIESLFDEESLKRIRAECIDQGLLLEKEEIWSVSWSLEEKKNRSEDCSCSANRLKEGCGTLECSLDALRLREQMSELIDCLGVKSPFELEKLKLK